jgi:hypothetical protein
MIVNMIGGIALVLAVFGFFSIWIGEIDDAKQNREIAKLVGLFLIAAAICFK